MMKIDKGGIYIPYGRQSVDEGDLEAVLQVLRSDWLTTGPKIAEFEEAFADFVGAKYAVAVSSGTAALHCAMYAVGIGKGDEVVVPSMTFAASANAVLYQRGTPVFADVTPDTLLVDPERVAEKITDRTKGILVVDYAGQPCEYDRLNRLAKENQNLKLIADSCHALGASYNGKNIGLMSDIAIFSFHPTKHITTGEGGMLVTNDKEVADRAVLFRNHGISSDPKERAEKGLWYYEMIALGFNYRITDIQAALGISQIKRLPAFLSRRREIAKQYDEAFADIVGISPLYTRPEVSHAYHLYVVKVDNDKRDDIFKELRRKGIGVNVHYIPVHLHPYYRETLGTGWGLCPVAECAYKQIISLPIFPEMKDQEIEYVIETIRGVEDTGYLMLDA